MTKRIPFTVIGGFLGAGKTSLLNHWLHSQNVPRTALLVNDFGELNIDASLISQQHGDTIALTNGCVCCNLGDDLSQALISVLDADPPFDAVIVEASGVSDPGRIAQMAMAAPELQRDVVFVLVDASMFLIQWLDPLLVDTLSRQLRSADIVVLNKVDLIDDATHLMLTEHLAVHAPGVPIIDATDGRVPPEVVNDITFLNQYPKHGCICCENDLNHHENLHANQFESWIAHPNQIWSLDQWRQTFLGLNGKVLRLKGFVRSHEFGWTEIQLAGNRLKLNPASAFPTDGHASLIAIGLRTKLPRETLSKLLI